jgi:hypothetical protein
MVFTITHGIVCGVVNGRNIIIIVQFFAGKIEQVESNLMTKMYVVYFYTQYRSSEECVAKK